MAGHAIYLSEGAQTMSIPTIKEITADLNPWEQNKAERIQSLHKLIAMLNKPQSERLYKAMRDITDASLIIDEIYDELYADYTRRDYFDVSTIKSQKLQSEWKLNNFGSLFKNRIDDVIFLYQRVAEKIPSLRKLWFS
jgi:hypothetical protein